VWVGSGFYRVQPDEQGVVLRFGAYSYWTPPGLHWHLPWPVETVQLPTVTRINRTEIGFRSATGGSVESGRDTSGRDILAESLMLTGDENIIDIDIAVFWRINDAAAFLFNAAVPETLVRGVAESSMREVIGRTPIQPALGPLRGQIEADVRKQTQEILDRYKAGVEITQVQLQKVDPPAAVIESFRDVQRANTDAERMRNEAESYRNDIVPRARGDAARIVAEGQGAKASSIAQATGQAQRFESVLKAYQAAKDVTLRRMYLDTMQNVMAHSQPLVIDDKLKGLVPFLPLNVPPPTPTVPTAPASSASVGASR
jgi:membrane protease subunit HflK